MLDINGTLFNVQCTDSKCIINDDESRNFVLGEIERMEANFGGTDILKPLQACQK